MKDITTSLLDGYAKAYQDDKTRKVVRHFLNKNDIANAANIQEASQDVADSFSIKIDTLPVANQMQSGRCWIFAGLNVLREEVAKKLNLESFELSQNYIAFYDKLEKINFMMTSLIDLKDRSWDDRTLSWVLDTGIQDGGQWDMFVALVKKYGVVAQSAMPETYASSHTHFMNTLLNRYLRSFYSKIKHLDDKAIESLKEETLRKCYGMLCDCFGIPPKSFNFEYVDKDKVYHKVKDLDPLRFYREYVGIDLDEYVSIINSPTADKPYFKTFTVAYLGNVYGQKVKYLNLPLDAFKEAILSQLKAKEVVWFGSDCGKFGDRTAGYWDQNSYDFDSLFDMDFSISKEDALMYRESAMNHAMVLTGVNLDEGKPNRWRIENSWGDAQAHKGYHVASDVWFDRYVYQAVVNKKHLDEKALSALKEKEITLDPWDPMGTLAQAR